MLGVILSFVIGTFALAFAVRTLGHEVKSWVEAFRGGNPCATCPLRQSCPIAGGCTSHGESFNFSLSASGGKLSVPSSRSLPKP